MTLAQERDVWTEYQHATGEERARLEDELVREHQNLAHFTARKFYSSRYDREDVLQVALIGLLKSIRGFDPATDMQFSTYAVKTMRRDIGHLIRDQYADKRKGEMENISIHLPLNNSGEREITIMDSVADENERPDEVAELRAMSRTVMDKADEFLYGNELKAFQLKYGSDIQLSSYQIGKRLNLSGMQVRRLCENAEFKMRAYFKNGVIPEKKKVVKENPWREDEARFLRKLLEDGKKRKEIIQQFPNRTEASVDNKIRSIRKQMREEGLL